MLDSYKVKLVYKVGESVFTETHWVTTRNKSKVLEDAKKIIIEKYGLTYSDIEEKVDL